MIEELRKYIEDLFAKAPKTRAAYDLKEELMANSTERYRDLVADHVPEHEALDIVIHSIGDINQLFTAGDPQAVPPYPSDESRKKTALYKAIAVGMYIFGFCIAVSFDLFFWRGDLGFIIMLMIAAAATSLLIYTNLAYPNYKKADDTMVEEFKEWNHRQKKQQSIRQSVNTILWMVILILYFLISFTTMAWYITWVIFLIGVCAQAIVKLLFQLKDYK